MPGGASGIVVLTKTTSSILFWYVSRGFPSCDGVTRQQHGAADPRLAYGDVLEHVLEGKTPHVLAAGMLIDEVRPDLTQNVGEPLHCAYRVACQRSAARVQWRQG